MMTNGAWSSGLALCFAANLSSMIHACPLPAVSVTFSGMKASGVGLATGGLGFTGAASCAKTVGINEKLMLIIEIKVFMILSIIRICGESVEGILRDLL